MTLPFRRRHHDDEATHDRARALTSRQMIEALDEREAAWLTRHLDDCGECRSDREAYLADRELLRSLRDHSPEPPRDLWARTSAALDREASSRRRTVAGGRGARQGWASGGWRGLPLGPAAGALIVLVVVAVSLMPGIGRPMVPSGTPGSSPVAVGTPGTQPTPIAVADAGPVGWIQPGADGSWKLFITDVDAVCPRARPSCRPGPLGEDDPGRSVDLGGAPTGVTISPNQNQLVVEARGEGTQPGHIFVVALPSAGPEATPDVTPDVTIAPTAIAPTAAPPTDSVATEPPTPSPTPVSTPSNAIEIASGVTMVGEAVYSNDGRWLAFSAEPSDGSTGPDLYLWRVGGGPAVAVTDDHETYFSSWLDGQLLASRVEVVAEPAASPEAPTPAPTAGASDAPAEPPLEGHPRSFLLDPTTLIRTEIAQPDVWLPVVDDHGRFAAYWSGTLAAVPGGHGWQLGTGQLVLDGWSDGTGSTPGPLGSPEATKKQGRESSGPATTPAPIGPTGRPTPLVSGATAVFQAKFDPTGTRLAVWVGEQVDAAIGRLHLIVLDAGTGTIDPTLAPLPGAPALRRFSIDKGRLAWVSPSGQDGQESAVQVLGWSKNDFGGIQTIPAKDLVIVR